MGHILRSYGLTRNVSFVFLFKLFNQLIYGDGSVYLLLDQAVNQNLERRTDGGSGKQPSSRPFEIYRKSRIYLLRFSTTVHNSI